MPPVGPLCSAGITPHHRSYGPIRQALAFTVLRLVGSHGYLASVVFLRGARSPSLFQPMALYACHHPQPRRTIPPLTRLGGGCMAFAAAGAARRAGVQTSRGLDRVFTHRYGPRTRSPRCNGALSVGFTRWISQSGATQAMRRRILTASGLSPYGSIGASRHHPAVAELEPHDGCAPSRTDARE